jgi:hypothetical protein
MSLYPDLCNPQYLSLADSATLTTLQIRNNAMVVMTVTGKTLTLPAPSQGTVNHSFIVANHSSGNLTLACSNGFLYDDDSLIILTGHSVLVTCRRVAASTYRYVVVGRLTPDLVAAEVTADLVGAMVTGNTETYISVTYDDSDNTLDFVVDATATPTASKIPLADSSGKLAAGWGGAASSLATLNASSKVVENPANATATPGAAKIPISDGSNHLDGWISTATAATPGLVEHQNWSDFVPTWTFTTADPAAPTKVGRYMLVGNMCTFYCSLESADGNDGVLTGVTLPVAPTDSNTLIPLRGHQKINAAWSDCLAFIDATTSLNIQLHTSAACTDAAACAYYLSGSYEVAAT